MAKTRSERKTWDTLESQLREMYGRVVYSHKTHEKCADSLLAAHSWIKISQIALSGVTALGFLVVLFGDGEMAKIIGGIFSLILFVLNAYTKNQNLGEEAQRHRQTASRLWLEREELLSLIVDLRTGAKASKTICFSRDKVNRNLSEIYGGAPSTNSKAYKKAQHALKIKGEMTFSEAEIDQLLPIGTRRGE